MKKFYGTFTIFYLLYAGAIGLYLLQLEPGYVPEIYKGTASDPSLFMNAAEIKEAYHLQLIEYFTYFLATPLDLLILILIMSFSVKIRNKAIAIAKKSRWQLAYYFTVLTTAMTLLYLPLDLFFYYLNKQYELSSQSFSSWSIDFAIWFALELVLGFLVILFLYWLIAKQPKKWWLTIAFLSLPFNILILFLSPVVFMPLFNDYQPIQNQALKAEIQELAEEVGIPNAKILEMNMSKQSNSMNAFVTGVGSNKIIVLGDTAIENMTTEEIKFVIAHEIGHYKLNHIYTGLILSFVLSFLLGYGTYKIYHSLLKRFGHFWSIEKQTDISAMPLLFLSFILIMMPVSPLMNAVYRYEERQADRYAIEMTENKEAAVTAFQKLAKSHKSTGYSPDLIHYLLSSHPRIPDRIHEVSLHEEK